MKTHAEDWGDICGDCAVFPNVVNNVWAGGWEFHAFPRGDARLIDRKDTRYLSITDGVLHRPLKTNGIEKIQVDIDLKPGSDIQSGTLWMAFDKDIATGNTEPDRAICMSHGLRNPDGNLIFLRHGGARNIIPMIAPGSTLQAIFNSKHCSLIFPTMQGTSYLIGKLHDGWEGEPLSFQIGWYGKGSLEISRICVSLEEVGRPA